MKHKETRLFYRYFKPEYLPNIGDKVERKGNHFTSLGEGVYCYLLDNISDDMDYMEERIIGVMGGVDIEYYQIVYDSDSDNKDLSNEVVIKPGQPLYLLALLTNIE